jgi:hypothetical protein
MTPHAENAKALQALNSPHGLFVVDHILKTKADGQMVQLTLGWTAPNEVINPVATLVMTADFASELAQSLSGHPTPTKKKIK